MGSLESAVSYAAPILIYGGVETTPENLQNLLDSANFKVNTIYIDHRVCENPQIKDVNDLLWSIGAVKSIGPMAANDTSRPMGGESESLEGKAEEKQEEAEEDEKEEENMVVDSFDQCDPCWRNSSQDLYKTP
ncbi:hypothetical protein AOL_s00215g271 [Orbilia oligospora ATCC 24927]|uniref:Uncharacterized protein n=1 Tax=Arthrobotrys oligospora (strain ATCC 24927 / CBS 115.81 / DSM 1491) TaxID=756982 RepID=G1XTZ2_ARTOA|nr:hypothetical protein AOL_s00215g271 [Orbilia oligospora ATCC 24927]EGX43535.1 hypothetical protein AOL_s00215g271 [Orbilia oligospora ATCC 24927]